MRFLHRSAVLVVVFAVAVAAATSLPKPESVLGFRPGADFKLATYDQSLEYFKKLAAMSKARQAGRAR